MCKVLKVSRAGYYKWRNRKANKELKDQELKKKVKTVFESSGSTYGSPRIADALNKVEFICSASTVARKMRSMKLFARSKRRFRHTTNSNHNYNIQPNLLDRKFNAETIGKAWVSDITYVKVNTNWMYLTVILDLADRMIVGWSLSNDLTAEATVIAAFKKAISYRMPEPKFLFHSDRGVQYACNDFVEQLELFECKQSMSRKGNCWDNAVAESFFKTIKVERLYTEKLNTGNQAYSVIFDYIDGWYNTKRIHTSLGGLTPLEASKIKSAA